MRPLILAAFLALSGLPAHAQFAFPGLPTGNPVENAPFIGAVLSEFISDSRSYTAQALIRVAGADGESQTIPANMALRDGKLRLDFDLVSTMGAARATEAAMIRQMGLDRISLVIGGTNFQMVLPARKSVLSMTTPDLPTVREETEKKIGFLEKKKTGEETIDGHNCSVYQLRTSTNSAPGEAAVLWLAEDLKRLPIQLRARSGKNSLDMRLRNVKLDAPADSVFSVPSDYTRHTDPQLFVQSILAGAFGNPPVPQAPATGAK